MTFESPGEFIAPERKQGLRKLAIRNDHREQISAL
jgi:hypothetical protein